MRSWISAPIVIGPPSPSPDVLRIGSDDRPRPLADVFRDGRGLRADLLSPRRRRGSGETPGRQPRRRTAMRSHVRAVSVSAVVLACAAVLLWGHRLPVEAHAPLMLKLCTLNPAPTPRNLHPTE